MKCCKHKTGVTLVEMLLVVAIIAILAAIVIGTAARIRNKANEQLTESTIAILTSALEQFHDYGFNYQGSYTGFYFPLDCNDFPKIDIQTTLEDALGLTAGSVLIGPVGINHLDEYSGSEVMYFFLSRVPQCRKTLDKIDDSLITNEGSNQQLMSVTITPIPGNDKVYPLLRIIDPWGQTLQYDYYEDWADYGDTWEKYLNYIRGNRRTFPVITSAGPDGIFDTSDDISSR